MIIVNPILEFLYAVYRQSSGLPTMFEACRAFYGDGGQFVYNRPLLASPCTAALPQPSFHQIAPLPLLNGFATCFGSNKNFLPPQSSSRPRSLSHGQLPMTVGLSQSIKNYPINQQRSIYVSASKHAENRCNFACEKEVPQAKSSTIRKFDFHNLAKSATQETKLESEAILDDKSTELDCVDEIKDKHAHFYEVPSTKIWRETVSNLIRVRQKNQSLLNSRQYSNKRRYAVYMCNNAIKVEQTLQYISQTDCTIIKEAYIYLKYLFPQLIHTI